MSDMLLTLLLIAAPFALYLLHRSGTTLGEAGRRRALPLLMVTVVVYFTGELWHLAARMTRQRLWQTIGFLAVVDVVFVITTIRDEVRA